MREFRVITIMGLAGVAFFSYQLGANYAKIQASERHRLFSVSICRIIRDPVPKDIQECFDNFVATESDMIKIQKKYSSNQIEEFISNVISGQTLIELE